MPVLYVNFASKPGFPRPNTPPAPPHGPQPTLIEGTWGVRDARGARARPAGLRPHPHVGVDGSYGTQLYPVLRMLERTTMLMTGVSTNLAVEGIVRASVNRGFDMVVIEDCCASYPDEWHRFSIDNIMPLLAQVTSADALIAALAAGA